MGDEPLGEFLHVASLLIPLYTPRAWEVMEYGPDGASLATAAPVADCFQIAYYCVRNSLLHPRCDILVQRYANRGKCASVSPCSHVLW